VSDYNYIVEISAEDIKKKVEEMGRQITADYTGKPLLVLGVLKGSVCFLADLMRAVEIPYILDFIGVSSYKDSTESAGKVDITFDLASDFSDRYVLIVEDIVDTGITLDYLINHIHDRGALDISVAVLLDKPIKRKVNISIKYKCFQVEDGFYVGYGLDYQGYLRNLPHIARLNLA